MSETFYRCGHCKGFYATTLPRCRYCNNETPLRGESSEPRVFPNREMCRAIQIAEYEQLPPAAHADHMKPPSSNPELECYCLHCARETPPFEAIEMRWIVNEKMWACPCTTCGGRGFMFDIHLLDPLFRCSECKYFYKPEKPTHKYAVCPKCGSNHADGWYMDADEDGEPIDEIEDEDTLEEAWDQEDSRAFDPPSDPTSFLDLSKEVEQSSDDIDHPRFYRDDDENALPEDEIPW